MSSSSNTNGKDQEEGRKRFKPANIGSRLPPVLEAQLQTFWDHQHEEQVQLQATGPAKPDFKTIADLPLSRIKRVMKADSDVAMVSAEAPVVFARACSMFILEITQRSWYESTSKDRRTVQKEDVYDAILKADVYDFLVDIVNGVLEQEREEVRQRRAMENNGNSSSAASAAGGGGYESSDRGPNNDE